MKNKTITILLGLFFIIIVLGLTMIMFYPENSFSYTIFNIGILAGQFSGLYLLIRNGTITQTIYWKIILFCFGVTTIGAMFKIMHWPLGNIFFISGFLIIAITYLIRFRNKKVKARLDILKLLWVLTTFILASLIILHLISQPFSYIGVGLLWITIIDFIVSETIKNKLTE